MKRTNTTLGLTLLLVAAAVALYSTDESDQFVAPHSEDQASQARARGKAWSRTSASNSGSHRRSERLPNFLEEFAVEPDSNESSAAERAQRVQKGALHRTRDLTEDLNLTPTQQQHTFALNARAHPDYHPHMRIKGVPANSDRAILDRETARDALYDLLDLDQQLDFEISELEEHAWWRDIIARLERELRRNTPAPQLPNRHPAPEREEPSNPVGPRPQPTSVRGNSLFGGTRD